MDGLKPTMQAILIADDPVMRDNILTGKKQITIREGLRDYELGRQLMVCDHQAVWAVLTDITDVRHCPLYSVTQEEWEADGFTSQQDLLDGMHRYYPSLTLNSPVTVVHWTNARGALVDNRTA